MSSDDVIYACGCHSFGSDCRGNTGGGGFCEKHKADTKKMTLDEYSEHWQRIRRDNEGKANWGNA